MPENRLESGFSAVSAHKRPPLRSNSAAGFCAFYHINKEQWITVALDGSVSDEQIHGFYIVFAYSSRKKDCEVLIFSKRDSNTVSPEGEGRDFLSAVIHSPFSPKLPIYDHKSRYYTPDDIVAKIEFYICK